jgi:hypothetical protein
MTGERIIFRKPAPGDQVESRRRMKDGVAMFDTGVIIRLSDGGYCVVRWDSDGHEHEVLMNSLRPRVDAANEPQRLTWQDLVAKMSEAAFAAPFEHVEQAAAILLEKSVRYDDRDGCFIVR